MKGKSETLSLWCESSLFLRDTFEVALTLRFHLRPAVWEARRASLSHHFALFIYVPIPWIASFTFNFIDDLGLRGFRKSQFKACRT